MSEVLLKQKQQAAVASQVTAQIENELGNLIDNDIELEDVELAEIDQEALLSFILSAFDQLIEEMHPQVAKSLCLVKDAYSLLLKIVVECNGRQN
jgi:hypothetical protein